MNEKGEDVEEQVSTEESLHPRDTCEIDLEMLVEGHRLICCMQRRFEWCLRIHGVICSEKFPLVVVLLALMYQEKWMHRLKVLRFLSHLQLIAEDGTCKDYPQPDAQLMLRYANGY